MWLHTIFSALIAGAVALFTLRPAQAGPESRADRVLRFLAWICVPVLALAVYLGMGRPDLPAAPAQQIIKKQ